MRQPGCLQPFSLDNDLTLAVALGEWDRDGHEEEWGVAVLLRFSPPQCGDHKNAHPLPRIDESLSGLDEAKVYSSIDLARAFWQKPVRIADRQKTVFACELGLFEWRRLPFEMCSASATFQRAITRALRKIVNQKGTW